MARPDQRQPAHRNCLRPARQDREKPPLDQRRDNLGAAESSTITLYPRWAGSSIWRCWRSNWKTHAKSVRPKAGPTSDAVTASTDVVTQGSPCEQRPGTLGAGELSTSAASSAVGRIFDLALLAEHLAAMRDQRTCRSHAATFSFTPSSIASSATRSCSCPPSTTASIPRVALMSCNGFARNNTRSADLPGATAP